MPTTSTSISTTELKNLAKSFLQGTEISQVEPLQNGNINSSWQVQTTTGQRFVLQQINPHVFTDIAVLSANLLRTNRCLQEYKPSFLYPEFCLVAGQPLLPTATGNYWRLYPWIEAQTLTPDKVTTAAAKDAGLMFGSFLRLMHPEPVSDWSLSIAGFHDLQTAIDKLQDARQANPSKHSNEITGLFDYLDNQQEFVDNLTNQTKNIPKRIIHHDAKIENLLFARNRPKVVAIIDLDTVMPGLALHDFGDLVRSIVTLTSEDQTSSKFNEKIFTSLSCSYLEATSAVISQQEATSLHLGPCYMTLLLAIRFLCDYILGDKYFKVTYPKQNLIRAKAQLTLFALLQEYQPWMRATMSNIHQQLKTKHHGTATKQHKPNL